MSGTMTKRGSEFPGADRRRVLALGAGGLAWLGAGPALGALRPRGERVLGFDNLHTGETLRAVYWADGGYVKDGLAGIDRILRDFRTGEVAPIDPALLDLLYALQVRLGTDAPFGVISGFRSAATNAQLRRSGGGVARRSLHLYGMAIDIRVPGRRLRDVRRAALDLRLGGVGYYPKPGFVHVDTGRVRFW
jgi:uncharacterized protein YcbK (DUF882 family)